MSTRTAAVALGSLAAMTLSTFCAPPASAESSMAAEVAAPPSSSAAGNPAPPDTPAPPDSARAPSSNANATPAFDAVAAQRETLFDIAFQALAAGELALAEQAFSQAALLPDDVAHRAVAVSFADRVRRLRAARARSGEPSGVGRALPPSTARSVRSSSGDPSGRVPLLLTTTALGLAVSWWTFPGMFGITYDETPRTFVGFGMLSVSASFLVPYVVTRGGPVTAAQANLAFYGGTRGLYLGVLTAAILAGNVGIDTRYRPFTAGLLLGSVAGLTAGFVMADRAHLTPGQARTMAVLGDFGLGFGFGTGYLLDFDASDKTQDQRARRMAGAGFLGAAVGLTGGYFLARHRDNSWGDGEVMRTSTLLGAWWGFTSANLFEVDGDPAITLVMTGALAGLIAGDRLVAATNYSVGHSILVDLGTLVAAAGVAGLLYLVSPEDWSERPFVLASALGGTAGLAVTHWAFANGADDATTAALSRSASAPTVSLLPVIGADGQRGAALVGRF